MAVVDKTLNRAQLKRFSSRPSSSSYTTAVLGVEDAYFQVQLHFALAD